MTTGGAGWCGWPIVRLSTPGMILRPRRPCRRLPFRVVHPGPAQGRANGTRSAPGQAGNGHDILTAFVQRRHFPPFLIRYPSHARRDTHSLARAVHRLGRHAQPVGNGRRLPDDIEEPVVSKQEADAQPFMWLALTGENYDLLQLTDVADRIVKTRLQSVPGVGRIFIGGERRYSMRVWLNASELAARSLTVQDVEEAIRSRNVEIPAGRIESDRREFTVPFW